MTRRRGPPNPVVPTIFGGGVLAFDVVVTNLTGHKFPTGFPSRRAWRHVTIREREGGVVFESGGVTKAGSIVGNDHDSVAATFEPHHKEITSPDAVQIYESVMGTPGGAPTTGLLQATQYLKDNRLLPRGFDKRTAAPEIAVVGAGATDADFTGNGDRVRYRIPMVAPGTIEVELRYQPISFRSGAESGGRRRTGAPTIPGLLQRSSGDLVRRGCPRLAQRGSVNGDRPSLLATGNRKATSIRPRFRAAMVLDLARRCARLERDSRRLHRRSRRAPMRLGVRGLQVRIQSTRPKYGLILTLESRPICFRLSYFQPPISAFPIKLS